MYIITARRMTAGELLKYLNGFHIAQNYGTSLGGSIQFTLTMPRLVIDVRVPALTVNSNEFLEWPLMYLLADPEC